MKKLSQLGLVIEGSAASSAVLRGSQLSDNLGPVKSGSLRVARRLSNVLRAGYAVDEYQDLQAARLILLKVPDASLPAIVDAICESGLVMKDLSFVLCESWLPSPVLQRMAEQGASTATVIAMPTVERNWFAVEGEAKAVRQMRRFLDRSGMRSEELKSGSKDLLFVSQLLAAALPVPMLTSAQQALRNSGYSGNMLSTLIEQMALKMLQDCLRGARGTWGGPLNDCASEVSADFLQSVAMKNPALAAFVNEQIRLAKRMMTSGK